MTKLQCQLCGGALVLDVSGIQAECEQCGMNYKKEHIQAMIRALSPAAGYSNVGAITQKAQQLADSGDFLGAKELYQTILDNVDPLSSEAWQGLLRCRYHFADMQLAGQLQEKEFLFLFDGRPAWDLTAFQDNLKNAVKHVAPPQREVLENEYYAFMEALPERLRESEANKEKAQLTREIDSFQAELGKLSGRQAERKASLISIRRMKRLRILWLMLAVLSSSAALYIGDLLITTPRSFDALLFEFIMILFATVVLWMMFGFYKSGDLKKERIAYIKNDASALVSKIADTELKLNEHKDRLSRLQ